MTDDAAPLRLPTQLTKVAASDAEPGLAGWVAGRLPAAVAAAQRHWGLRLGPPYEPGGYCSWVAPGVDRGGRSVVLKVGWPHEDSAHEPVALRAWAGAGAVLLLDVLDDDGTRALLLERCEPGATLGETYAGADEPEQDVVLAGVLRRLRAAPVPAGLPTLEAMCARWVAGFHRRAARSAVPRDAGPVDAALLEAAPVDAAPVDAALCDAGPVDVGPLDAGLADAGPLGAGLVAAGLAEYRALAASASEQVLLCTDLHAGNVLSARREPWLAIDPKPHVGDPAYDATQHLLNCPDRLAADPVALARRMADLLDVDPDRVVRWLFARGVVESFDRPVAAGLARTLAGHLGRPGHLGKH